MSYCLFTHISTIFALTRGLACQVAISSPLNVLCPFKAPFSSKWKSFPFLPLSLRCRFRNAVAGQRADRRHGPLVAAEQRGLPLRVGAHGGTVDHLPRRPRVGAGRGALAKAPPQALRGILRVAPAASRRRSACSNLQAKCNPARLYQHHHITHISVTQAAIKIDNVVV